MRARIKLSIDPSRSWDDLRAALDHHDWIPAFPQDNPIVQAVRADILADIGAENQGAAAGSALLVIRDEHNDTWGLVSNVVGRTYTIRLKKSDSETLKTSTTRLVNDLQLAMTRQFRDRREAFQFQPRIDVLLPSSNLIAFRGTIQAPKRFRTALQDRRSEAALGLVALAVAVALLVTTSPLLFGQPLPGADPWYIWAAGNLERLATAAIVTAAVSWLEVVIRWFQIQRQPTVRWSD